jgi:hypothetical protein
MIFFLDVLEENTDLSLEEWNFRQIVSQQLQELLHQEKIYWKQRGIVKWIQFGDECTRFFHANASIKHGQNSITSLKDESRRDLADHEQKAEFIWNSFKDRLGISEFNGMITDLASILSPNQDLDWIQGKFQKEEIDRIIANLPNNKSPGPDGFNGEFLKKCWNVLAQDFYGLCKDFYEGTVCLQSINSSFMTLIPKKDCP